MRNLSSIDGLAAILVLNAADAIFTLLWVQLGLATEANPLLAHLAHQRPVLFVAVKLAVVSLGVMVLFQHRARKLSHLAMASGLVAYSSVCVYHFSFALQL